MLTKVALAPLSRDIPGIVQVHRRIRFVAQKVIKRTLPG